MFGVQFNATLASISSALEGAPRALKEYSYFEITEDKRMMSPSTAFIFDLKARTEEWSEYGRLCRPLHINEMGGMAPSKKKRAKPCQRAPLVW